MQQRVCGANSTLSSVHGGTLLNSGTGGGGYPFFRLFLRYAAVLERERKNLPPMMQEREKDWSRRPVFAQAKSRPNIDITTQKIETSTSK